MLNQYLKDIYKTYKTGDATEASFYTDLKKLLESFLKSKGIDPNITIQPRKTQAGIPDFTIRKSKELIGYIEAKDLSIEDLGKIEDTEQIKRYKEKLPNFILTNYFDFWLWRRDAIDEKKGQWIKKVRIGQPITLKINTPPPPQKEKDFFELLNAFFSYYLPERKTAKSLAIELASRTQLLPPYIIEELNNEESEVFRIYSAFKQYLISDLTKENFADIYAQTITYGLFTARLRYEGKDFNRFLAQELIPKNIKILHDTFNLISHEKLAESLAWIIDDMATILAHADIRRIREELHHEKGGDDPLMHFYETFLAEYNPAKRKAKGVYYTPLPVVSYITRSINILLKEKFNKKLGFASENVTLLDPASGTLTFPSNAIRIAKKEIDESTNAGSWPQIVKDHILQDYYAFELLMAPYIIGHLKASLLLEDLGYKMQNGERFKLYLTNTLDLSDVERSTLPFVAGLSEEAIKAGAVKKDTPILVIMGNPPYSVSSSNIIKEGSGLYNLYESYKEIVRKEERNIQPLSDDYIKFIAFAHWKIKQTGQGIVGMITNNSYLGGLIHRDMRKKLAEDFDKIYILNLHGNSRIKEKAPDDSKDENVFDIQQGVGIILLIKKEGLEKKINYFDLYGLREEKYKFLENQDVNKIKWEELKVKEPNHFFVPRDTKGEKLYDKFISLKDIFSKYNAGIATGKDEVLVDFNKESLIRKLSITDKDLFKTVMENYGVSGDLIEKWYQELKNKDIKEQIKTYNYRPFDNRFVIYNPKILQRARKEIMDNFLNNNIGLILRKNISCLSWRHAFITTDLMDGNYLEARTHVFPLFVYPTKHELTSWQEYLKKLFLPKGSDLLNYSIVQKLYNLFPKPINRLPNFKYEILENFNNIYKNKFTPEGIFYYIYAILYSNIYRKKYNEFLKIDFPKVPFTKDIKLFNKISKLGKELIDLHLLKSNKLEKSSAKFLITGDNRVKKRRYNKKEKRICINDSQDFENVDPEVWDYYIGGYQVLDKWLKDRINRVLSADDVNHFLKVITVLKLTIEIQKEIDKLYPEVEKSLIK